MKKTIFNIPFWASCVAIFCVAANKMPSKKTKAGIYPYMYYNTSGGLSTNRMDYIYLPSILSGCLAGNNSTYCKAIWDENEPYTPSPGSHPTGTFSQGFLGRYNGL